MISIQHVSRPTSFSRIRVLTQKDIGSIARSRTCIDAFIKRLRFRLSAKPNLTFIVYFLPDRWS